MVELTQELLNKMFEYEPATGRLIWKDYPVELEPSKRFLKTFKKRYLGKEAGCLSMGYKRVAVKGRKFFSHRLIWCLNYGSFPKNEIDHINHNGLDNRICNLREVNHRDNSKNKPLQCNNSSGVTGVYWHKQAQRWIALVNDNGKNRHLGYYVSLEEAAQVAKKAREELGFHCNHGV